MVRGDASEAVDGKSRKAFLILSNFFIDHFLIEELGIACCKKNIPKRKEFVHMFEFVGIIFSVGSTKGVKRCVRKLN